MANKIWDKPINKNTDWGGDESTDNLPVSGRIIQSFIKDYFKTKAGIFYYDTTNNRYLVFADEESKNKYIEDPTNIDLILGTFDAPFNYTAEINLITPTYVAILTGTKNQYIDFTFDIKNKSGQSVGEDVIVNYTFIKGSNKKVVTQRYKYGTSVHFNIDKYIEDGTNNIIVSITGQNTLAATSVAITYQVVNLILNDSLDISKVYNLSTNPDSTVAIPYTVSGYGVKTMEWYLDGEQIEYNKVEDEILETTSSRVKYISLSDLNQGKHSIQFRAYTIIEGEKFYSNILYRDVIVYNGTDKNPIIGVAVEIPTGNEILTPEDELNLYGITQYIPYNIKFAVYNPTGAASTNAEIYIDDALKSTITTYNNQEVNYSFTNINYGVHTLKIKVDSIEYIIKLNIEKSSTSLEDITNELELDLQSIGKSNNTLDKDKWEYNDFTTTFKGFNWNATSGWNNNRLIINNGASIEVNIAPLSNDPTDKGKTLEFEFSTSNVSDDNAVICDLRNSNGTGLYITASEATLISAGKSKVTTKFKSEENIRIGFVINKKLGVTNKGLAFIYINGIISGAVNYASTDNFTSDAILKIASSDKAEVNLKSLRFYNTALTSDQMLNNYILYRDSIDELLSLYDKNNIYEEGSNNFSTDILSGQLPIMIITGDIPALEATNDKNLTIVVDVDYTNLQDPSRSFTLKSAQMKPQGTSSMSYPKKNFRLYTRKRDDTKLYDSNGKLVENGLYSFKENAQPVDCWCMKADYAESSGTHNTGIARLWNDVMVNAQIDGEYLLRTGAQKKAIENNYEYDVRTTVDGFPILMFYRLTPESDLVFIGKYNFNNDKSTESVFGFKDIPGFDNTNMQCWEVLNNGNHLALFQDVNNFDSEWTEAFEARYPDEGEDASTTKLKEFCTWVVSTKDNIEKFKTEKWDHLDVYKVAAYYIYIMRFGAVDQTVKNAMLTSEDGEHFYYINYDNDTILGVRNDGLLIYPPTIDRQSLDDTFSTTVYAYAGHESTLWNNLEADEEFMSIISKVDNALYSAGLSYKNVINIFDTQQSEKWCERVYNQDAQYKYIGTFTDAGVNNLYMLQGARRAHRKWWISRRFNLLDSKYVSGDYKANSFELKMANAPIGIEFSITSGFNMNYGYGVNNIPIETGIKLNEGESHTFTTKQVLNIGDPLRIYSAVNLKEIDVHNFIEHLSTITVSSVYNEVLGTKLKKLVLGVDTSSDERRNTSISTISGLSSAKRLEYLDISGYKGISYLDLSELKYLTTLKAKSSGLISVILPNGSPISTLELPDTYKIIDFNSLPNLGSSNIDFEGGTSILTDIKIINCPKFNSDYNFISNWFKNKTTPSSECSLEIDNIIWNNIEADDLIAYGELKSLSLKGYIRLVSATQEQVAKLREIFGDNCFNKESELYINAPDAVYITGPSEVLEGNTAQYLATVFSDYKGTIFYSIVGSDYRAKINSETGLLTTTESGSSDSTIKVRATHTPTQGSVSYAEISVTIKKRIYPTSVTILGDSLINTGTKVYTLQTIPSLNSITGEFTSEWTLEGNGFDEGYIRISKQSKTECTLEILKVAIEDKSVTLKVTLTKKVGGTVIGTLDIQIMDENVIMTSTSNPEVIGICYNQGWCSSRTVMTKQEAALVTNLNKSFSANSSIKKFDEFKYFTGVTILNEREFYNCVALTSIILPDSIIEIKEYAFDNCLNLKNIILGNNVNIIGDSAFHRCVGLKYLDLPDSVTSIGTNLIHESSYIEYITIPKNLQNAKPGYNNSLFGECSNLVKLYSNSDRFIVIDDIFLVDKAEKTLIAVVNSKDGREHLEIPESEFISIVVPNAMYKLKYKIYTIPNTVDTFKGGIYSDYKIPIEQLNLNCKSITNRSVIGGSFPPEGVKIYLNEGIESIIGNVNSPLFPNRIHPDTNTFVLPSTLKRIENGVFSENINSSTKGYLKFDTSNNSYFRSDLNDTVLIENSSNKLLYILLNKENADENLNIDIDLSSLDSVLSIYKYFTTNIKSYKVTSLKLPPNVEELEDNSLGYLSYLNSLEFPSSLKRLGISCLEYIGVSNLVIPSTITSIGGGCFRYGKFETCDFKANVDTIPGSCFSYSNLKTFIVPNNILTIESSAFGYNKSLEEITIGDKVSNIESNAFWYCNKLATIKSLNKSAPTVDRSVFGYSRGGYTGDDTYDQGINKLIVPENATGYDTGTWLDPLCTPSKCGFTLEKSLPAVETVETLSAKNNILMAFASKAINTMSLSDEKSLEYKDIYPKYKDLIGEDVTKGFKLTYNNILYKVIKDHKVSSEWLPDKVSSLYTPITSNPENPKTGTIDNPIKWVIGMELTEGLYYEDEGHIYKCIRNSGIGMSFNLKDLVSGGFVELVK